LMIRDRFWRLLFSAAIAILMLKLLLVRTEPTPVWVLIVYPSVGALLAYVASRTSPTVDEIAWIETGTSAAACIVVLAALVNLLIIELLVRQVRFGESLGAGGAKTYSFIALPTIAVLLWWALERRLTRMRRMARDQRPETPASGDTPAPSRTAKPDAPAKSDRAA